MLKALDRIVITLGSLVLIAVGVTAAALAAGWNGMPMLVDLVSAARHSGRIEAALLGLLGMAVGLYMLSAAWQKPDGDDDIQLEADGGVIRIALQAIESVVFEAAAEVDGVAEVTAHLRSRDGELLVDVQVHVSSDRAMPDTARDVQRRVGARIQQVAGVPVGRLDVRVRRVAKSRRPRIE